MWGTHPASGKRLHSARFIPTHVGNTFTPLPRGLPRPVQPHACGEHSARAPGGSISGGSSPRMWGTRGGRMTTFTLSRFIPTHVGNTTRDDGSFICGAVHPHACGEHMRGNGRFRIPCGSSPRMWGTHRFVDRICRINRFIPTHVGNTGPITVSYKPVPVHPHACGEHSPKGQMILNSNGSSPRMWGTLKGGEWLFHQNRFIPTHVGNTPADPLPLPGVSVHPHACGEHPLSPPDLVVILGSSPRMWGTRRHPHLPASPYRFIPTHVGNTTSLLSR